MSNQKVLDLTYGVVNDLDEQNYGKAREKLAKITELANAKLIKKQQSKAAENTVKITEALAALRGKDPDEIAEFLLAQGHKGEKGSTRRCPMARYLTAHDGVVRVDGMSATSEDGSGVWLEDDVRRFVRRFDNGAYPELVGGDEDE